MRVRELIQFLEKQDQERSIAFSIYTTKGPKTYRISNVPSGKKEFQDKEGEQYLLIAHVDDCSANRIK